MLEGLIKFQIDRGLEKQEFVSINELTNIFEEMLESVGLDVPKAKRPALREFLQDGINGSIQAGIAKRIKAPSEEEQVDAYCDMITFSVGAILKLGYDPKKAIEQCSKEINSRVGKMVDGKFEKDLSKDAQAKWYKADYSRAKGIS
jgi:hypothetical protein